MPRDLLTVDADGHVLEPTDTWQRYIDPKFRDRALRAGIDAPLPDAAPTPTDPSSSW